MYWMAYSTIEPFGDARGDLQAAIVSATIANRHRGPREPEYSWKDFTPNFTPRKRLISADSQKDFFKQMTLLYGGKVVSGKRQDAA